MSKINAAAVDATIIEAVSETVDAATAAVAVKKKTRFWSYVGYSTGVVALVGVGFAAGRYFGIESVAAVAGAVVEAAVETAETVVA